MQNPAPPQHLHHGSPGSWQCPPNWLPCPAARGILFTIESQSLLKAPEDLMSPYQSPSPLPHNSSPTYVHPRHTLHWHLCIYCFICSFPFFSVSPPLRILTLMSGNLPEALYLSWQSNSPHSFPWFFPITLLTNIHIFYSFFITELWFYSLPAETTSQLL